MLKAFDEEAWKYNVYPLYDDAFTRLAKQQYRMFGDQKEFVYYAPGAVNVPDRLAAPIKGASHEISTRLDLDGKREGVIVSCGGYSGGYSLFIKNNRLHYNYNYLSRFISKVVSPPLPKGEDIELKFRFTIKDESKLGPREKTYGGVGELFVNGEKVAEAGIKATQPSTFQFTETFDVGYDYGTQVSDEYTTYFPYNGKIDRVKIKLTN